MLYGIIAPVMDDRALIRCERQPEAVNKLEYWRFSLLRGGSAQIRNMRSFQNQDGRGFHRISYLGDLFRECPSPSGRGWREAPGEGGNAALIRPFGPRCTQG